MNGSVDATMKYTLNCILNPLIRYGLWMYSYTLSTSLMNPHLVPCLYLVYNADIYLLNNTVAVCLPSTLSYLLMYLGTLPVRVRLKNA